MSLLIFLCFSCGNKKENKKQISDSLIELGFIKNVSIAIDDQTKAAVSHFQYYEENQSGDEYLCILNELTNSINIYPFKSGKPIQIKFPKEGPNGVGRIGAFYFLNPDTIFVINTSNFRVFRADKNAYIHRSFSLIPADPGANYSWPFKEEGMEIKYKNDTLFIPAIPGIYFDKYQRQFFDQGRNMIKLSLSSGHIDNIIAFPNKSLLFDKNYTNSILSAMTISGSDKNTNILSFRPDPNLYIYDNFGKLIGTHLIESKYITQPIEGIKNSWYLGDTTEEFLYFLNHTFYDRVIYDRHRKLYYRMIKHATNEPLTRKMIITGKQIKHAYSMIVMDEKFNKIGELDIPLGLGKGIVMPVKEGILMQTGKNENEDEIKFELYKISKI